MPEPRAIVPDKGIRPGLNSTGTEIARHVAVRIEPAGTEDPTEISLPLLGGPIFGINVQGGVAESGAFGLPDGEIGDIQVEGRAPMVASVAIAVGNSIAVAVTGKAKVAATGEIIIGQAVTSAAALDDVFEIELAGAAQSRIAP